MRIGIREAIFFLVLLAVPAVSLLYVFKPRNQEIRQALAEIEVKQSRLDTLAEVTARIQDLGNAIDEGREAIELIDRKLPDDKDVEGIIEQVWVIAKENDLTVIGVKSEKPVPAANYRELPLKMQVEGDFEGFYQFLLEMENLPRITRVHELDIERATPKSPKDEAPGGLMMAKFTLSIYFKPDALPAA